MEVAEIFRGILSVTKISPAPLDAEPGWFFGNDYSQTNRVVAASD